jgi:hypothetical protein
MIYYEILMCPRTYRLWHPVLFCKQVGALAAALEFLSRRQLTRQRG